MSTRSAVGYQVDGDEIMAIYVHSDGYPSGVGAEVVKAIKAEGVDAFLKRFVDDSTSDWSSFDRTHNDRAKTEPGFIADDSKLVYHTVDEAMKFCDWAYIVDRQRQNLTVYGWEFERTLPLDTLTPEKMSGLEEDFEEEEE